MAKKTLTKTLVKDKVEVKEAPAPVEDKTWKILPPGTIRFVRVNANQLHRSYHYDPDTDEEIDGFAPFCEIYQDGLLILRCYSVELEGSCVLEASERVGVGCGATSAAAGLVTSGAIRCKMKK